MRQEASLDVNAFKLAFKNASRFKNLNSKSSDSKSNYPGLFLLFLMTKNIINTKKMSLF